jgi:hypothetical protein
MICSADASARALEWEYGKPELEPSRKNGDEMELKRKQKRKER